MVTGFIEKDQLEWVCAIVILTMVMVPRLGLYLFYRVNTLSVRRVTYYLRCKVLSNILLFGIYIYNCVDAFSVSDKRSADLWFICFYFGP